MNIDAYIDSFKTGSPIIQTINNLYGRIIRGTKEKDFETLSDDQDRKIVFLINSDGLKKIIGKTGYEILTLLAYEEDYLIHKVNEGNKFKLAVFSKQESTQIATWDNLFHMLYIIYPETKLLINTNVY